MNMTRTPDSSNDDRGSSLLVAAAMTAMLFVAMGVSAPNAPASQTPIATGVEAASAARFALSEREWNQREDLKAGSNVSPPYVY